MKNLQHQIAIISGGLGDIGRSIALKLASMGLIFVLVTSENPTLQSNS